MIIKIENTKFDLCYENNVYLNQNNDNDVTNNSNMENNIFIDEPNISNKSQNFELISNYSTESIIDRSNTNGQIENTFDEFIYNIDESYYSTPNFKAINDDNIETSNSDFNLNTDVNYDNTFDNTVCNLASKF
ncbi:hypothetical protein LY90DRAFT_510371 [Neocallimastix californiae]|uniref:Uncharacterized protein n=1 Tax=Neocallimastix californiae TaxID=1754190 RepID=A0A1Y2C132_9FUNG|nr:hypothetical protein LY90DRAFT_510371 [Neocallimastix californiae]|eukprot:ORY40587.1 hypothetical protein LY90DRAFT_510371 [Neocallimastix californiae]